MAGDIGDGSRDLVEALGSYWPARQLRRLKVVDYDGQHSLVESVPAKAIVSSKKVYCGGPPVA